MEASNGQKKEEGLVECQVFRVEVEERKLVRRWLTDEKSFMWFRGQRYEAGESREFVWLRKSGREDEL